MTTKIECERTDALHQLEALRVRNDPAGATEAIARMLPVVSAAREALQQCVMGSHANEYGQHYDYVRAPHMTNIQQALRALDKNVAGSIPAEVSTGAGPSPAGRRVGSGAQSDGRRESLTNLKCPFCSLSTDRDRVVWRSDVVIVIRDLYPVTPGHTLIVTRNHTADYFSATLSEKVAIWEAIEKVKKQLDDLFNPDGYNVGFNVGEAAGQTVPHLHVHVIPRHSGDVADPRGGVRGVIPQKQKY